MPFCNATGKSVRVGLVAQEAIRSAGLESVFEDHPYIRLIPGELDGILTDPSISYVILDLSSNAGWIKTIFSVRRRRRDMRQVVLGPAGEDDAILHSLSAGARAFLDTSSGPLAVRQAVECVIDGTIWAPRRIMSMLIDRLLMSAGANPAPSVDENERLSLSTSDPALSPREQEVLKLITLARSNREIAHILGIEERTVKAHVASLFRKTGMENRVSLLVRATKLPLAQSAD